MKVFMPSSNIYNAVDAVKLHGYAAVEGTKSHAVPYLERVKSALTAYPAISPAISFQKHTKRGYLYFMYDLNRYREDQVKPLINALS
ncbi:hypothetical protein PSCICE_50110 [Pseudomonas cichorii]|nr:hypothetical protein PSCICE_50110 [Pseudomonas cichorii]